MPHVLDCSVDTGNTTPFILTTHASHTYVPLPAWHPPPLLTLQAAQAPGWLALLRTATDDSNGPSGSKQQQLSTLLSSVKPESEEYGISSFVYRARRPFHPGRLYNSLLKQAFLTRVTQVRPAATANSVCWVWLHTAAVL